MLCRQTLRWSVPSRTTQLQAIDISHPIFNVDLLRSWHSETTRLCVWYACRRSSCGSTSESSGLLYLYILEMPFIPYRECYTTENRRSRVERMDDEAS